jgi:uncharacterized protein YggE
MTHRLAGAILGGIAALALCGPATAQGTGEARFATTTLDLSGHGEAHAPPDEARITLGVTADGATAAAAMQANAADMTRVIDALHAAGLQGGDIQTSSLSLGPRYADAAAGEAPRLVGYTAENQVTLTIADLARIGAVLDAAVSAGATNVGQISFELKTRAAAENFARMAAVKDLDDKAAMLATAAGYHIKRLVNLSEATSESSPGPRPMFAMAKAATPVEAGDITVSVDVTGEFELAR